MRALIGWLEALANSYRRGDFPSADCHLDLDLFNSYRSYLFAKRSTLKDEMGAIVVSAIARGDSEVGAVERPGFGRLRVQSGQARVSMQKPATGENVDVVLTAGGRSVVDLPALWEHSVTNLGGGELVLECSGITSRGATDESTGANP